MPETTKSIRFSVDAPVLMIGHGSSGTSILATLLREQLGVAFGTESQFIVHYYKRRTRYGDLADEQNLRRLVNHILTERYFRRSAKFGFRTDADAIIGRIRHRSYGGVLETIFGEFARQLGMTRWGDKTPAYSRDLEVLAELFPNAQFIHIVRDGRDVALSVAQRSWGHKNVHLAALEWRNEIDLIDRFVRTLPSDRFIEVRYEDLLAEPVATMRRLAAFLRVSDPDGAILAQLERTVPSLLNRSNFDKWRKAWPLSRRLAFERIACEQLRRHRYETVVETPEIEAGTLTRAFWRCDDNLKRWIYADYWKDNLYKACWRGRNAMRALSLHRV